MTAETIVGHQRWRINSGQWFDADGQSIDRARMSYDMGTVELVQRRVGDPDSGDFDLVMISRKEPVARAPYFFTPADPNRAPGPRRRRR